HTRSYGDWSSDVCSSDLVVKGKRVAVLGLAFKANTDDVRFAPALDVVKGLLEEGAIVHATDPEAMSRTKSLFPQLHYHEDPYDRSEEHTSELQSPYDLVC